MESEHIQTEKEILNLFCFYRIIVPVKPTTPTARCNCTFAETSVVSLILARWPAIIFTYSLSISSSLKVHIGTGWQESQSLSYFPFKVGWQKLSLPIHASIDVISINDTEVLSYLGCRIPRAKNANLSSLTSRNTVLQM